MTVADHHSHTMLCKHASGELPAYVETAREKGMPQFAFCDHAPAPGGYDRENRMDLDQFPVYRELVAGAAGIAEPQVLFGIEADHYEGSVEFLSAWLPQQPFDLALGSVHFIGDWGFDNPVNRKVWDSVDVTQTWREYFRLLSELADTRLFDVVAHLDLPKKFGHRPADKDLVEMACPALDRIRAAGMAVEINTSGLRKPVHEIYPSPLLLSLVREREIPICFGSDAHTPKQVGADFDKALALARDAGYAESLRFSARERELVPLPPP